MESVNFMNEGKHLVALNTEQREAATILEGSALVLAGAGSGKTRVVTSRIVHLIESGIAPSAILGVTFTNKAAEEMRQRVSQMIQHRVLVCTFHSLGARILRESIYVMGYERNFTIYDQEDSEKLIKSCVVELNKKLETKSLKNLISQAKNALQGPDEVSNVGALTDVEQAFPQVYALYQKKLQQYQAVDFDDLLFLTVHLWKTYPHVLERYQERWPFVLIDEYQDTNMAQYEMTRLLVEKRGNLFVVGDPDQSIYSWRGADINNILNFEHDYPGAKIIRLEQNYRSCTNILDAANELISCNRRRYDKKLWSQLGTGEKIKLYVGQDERAEADFVARQIHYYQTQSIPLNEMVIFYRTNSQSRVLEDALYYFGIPYTIVGGISFYQRREIKDILSFLRMAQSGTDFVAFERTVNLPKRGLGAAAIEKIRKGAEDEGLTILAYCEALLKEEGHVALSNEIKLMAKQKEGLKEYVQIMHQLRHAMQHKQVHEIVLEAIEQSGYLAHLKEDKETFTDRKANLDQLITKAIEWEVLVSEPTLEAFLEELALKSNLDEANLAEERLSLMTIHNGKGLEFVVTFLIGLEEDLFPHINSKDSLEEIEEERRLCYVGMTRAKKQLYLSYCMSRYLWGHLRMQRPSRFIKEIPSEYIDKIRQAQTSQKGLRDYKPASSVIDKKPAIQSVKKIEEFATGDTVYHQEFGIGQVKEAYSGSMGLTYKIFFSKDSSTRTLVAKYAPLNRL